MSFYEMYKENPENAMQEFIKEYISYNGCIFIWTCCKGKDSVTKYGSYKNVKVEELKNRKYKILCCDCTLGLEFTDCVYNNETRKIEMIKG